MGVGMRVGRATHRVGAVVALSAFFIGGCIGAPPASAPAPTGAGPPSRPVPASAVPSVLPSALPSATPAVTTLAVCPPPAPGSSPVPAEPGVWPGLNPPRGLSAAAELAGAELVAAIGNPDVGSTSPAWDAFEAAVGSGREVSIRSTADIVIGHLRTACSAVAPFFDEPAAGAWAADMRGLLDGLASVTATIREGAIAHDAATIAAARQRQQTVMLDHFWQSMKGSDPEAFRVTLRNGLGTATASHVRWSAEAGSAFDGDERSAWQAGDVPGPQWIELDLGREAAVRGVRLVTWQERAGPTDHLVTFRTGAGTEQGRVPFVGSTDDRMTLAWTAATPIDHVRHVRITTLATPSQIGWREIEVTLAPLPTSGPCPVGTTPLPPVVQVRSDPSGGVSDPALAVDGNAATGWDPGPLRGGTDARGWIRVFYRSQVEIQELRILLGPGSTDARYEVVLFPPGELGEGLGTLGPVPAGGGWLSLPGPNPCLPYESVYIWVRSVEPAGSIREIEVRGTIAP